MSPAGRFLEDVDPRPHGCEHSPVRTALLLTLLLAFVAPRSALAVDAPPTVAALLEQGREALERKAYSQAEQLFRKALEQAPADPILHNEVGVALFQQGAYAAAQPEFEKATGGDPNFAHAWANLAETLRRLRQFRQAAVAYSRFLGLEKGDRYGLFGLGLAFEGYEAYDKALQTLGIASRAAQGDSKLLARINGALRRIREIAAGGKQSPVARGDAHLAAGRLVDAMAAYERGLREKPDDGVLIARRGLVMAIRGDFAAALVELRKGVLLAPEEPVGRGALAMVEAEFPSQAPVAAGEPLELVLTDRAALAKKELSQAEGPALVALRGEATLRLGLVAAAKGDLEAAKDERIATAALAEVLDLEGDATGAKAQRARAKSPVGAADLPVWRRSLLRK